MLDCIRKQKRPMCRGLIILLLSSWVSYVCQPCFAHVSDGEQQQSINKMPCHPVNQDAERLDHDDTGNSPKPDCECHMLTALTHQDPDAWSTAPANSGFDLPMLFANQAEMESWPDVKNPYRILPVPERANSPPFYRYTVLLN